MYTLNGKLGIVVPCTDPIFTASTCYAIRILKRMGGNAARTLMQNVCETIDPMSFQVCTVSALYQLVEVTNQNRQTSTITNHQPSTINPKTPIHTQNETSYILQLRLKFHCAFLRSFRSLNFTPSCPRTSLHATFEKGLDF